MQKRFVVVDDAPFMREIIKRVLSDAGHICVGEANDGEEAVSVVSKTLPDFIILDMVMPFKNGIQVARAIKELDLSTLIIGCSTIDDDEIIIKAYKNGFDAYIKKPFTKDDFIRVLDRVYRKESDVKNV